MCRRAICCSRPTTSSGRRSTNTISILASWSGPRRFGWGWSLATCASRRSPGRTAAACGWTAILRSGVALRLPVGPLLAVDVDLTRSGTVAGDRRALAVGGEHWFGEWFGVRGGARVNLAQEERQMAGALGLSVALTPGFYIDAQMIRGRESTERGWSLAGRIGL